MELAKKQVYDRAVIAAIKMATERKKQEDRILELEKLKVLRDIMMKRKYAREHKLD